MNVVITGAGTILGRPLALDLAAAGHRVTALYRSVNGWLDGLDGHAGIRLAQADLSEPGQADAAIPADSDIILHLAATSAGPGVGIDKLTRDNVEGTRLVAEAALGHGVPRIVYMSSMSVYGEIDEPVVTASTPIRNPSPYGVTKRLGEQILEADASRLATTVLRLPALVGRGAHRHWLAQQVAAAQQGREIAIFNPAAPFNNAVHVDDMVQFLTALVERPFAGFDAVPLGSSSTIPVREVVERIVSGLGSTSRITERAATSRSFIIDSSLAVAKFGYRPSTIEDVLSRYIAAYRPEIL